MSDDLRVTDVHLAAAGTKGRASGLVGFISCTLNDCLEIQGITLRRTASGKSTLGYPAREDRYGQFHQYLRPVDEAARCEIEDQILAALGLRDGEEVTP